MRRFLGVSTPDATLLSVPPDLADAVRALGADVDAPAWRERLAAILDRPDVEVGRAVFRWSTAVADLEDLGVWLPVDDPRVPRWLHPFGGEVLLALPDGVYLGGVGRKIHDRYGHELAVVTEEASRGRGVARRLVATAARRVLADGAVPTYLHLPENTASARVADAVGFPDRGWSVWELFHPRGTA